MRSDPLVNRTRIPVIVFILLIISCGQSGPRNLEDAKSQAKYDFYIMMFDDQVDTKYYDEPIFVKEDNKFFVFRWVSNIPGVRPTVEEGYVPKDRKNKTGFRTIQHGAIGLGGTLDYPLTEAALYSLFDLALNESPEVLRLRKVPLTTAQLEDVSNFTTISNDLSQYTFCFNCAYPDSLSWFCNAEEIERMNTKSSCSIRKLDSLDTYDRYGYEYYYRNFIKFIILGTPGANRKWDFGQAIFDSLYNDQFEHIYTNNDDIIVKLIPTSSGCD
jgi:hypothetical protein